jgi:type VI secretion system secreted protein VgrG
MTVITSSRFLDDERYLTLVTNWNGRQLQLRTFSGTETMSQPFEFELDLVSEDLRIPFRDVIGKRVAVGIRHRGELGIRWFNGYISRFTQLPNESRMAHYRAVMVPWLWFLSQTADCRIFQNLTIPDIVTEILREYGVTDYVWRLDGQYEKWDYCVQYRETALNFIMRLLEQEGIYFFFEQSLEKHILVLADGLSHPECPGTSRVRYEHAFGEGVLRSEDTVLSWRHEQNFQPGTYTLQDYNFEKPRFNLSADAPSATEVGDRRFEIYDFPGEYEVRGGGEGWAKIRMEEDEAAKAVISGDSCCRNFAAGYRFEIDQLEHASNGSYFLTSVTHRARQAADYSSEAEQELEYENSFTCLPVEVQYRPPRMTPKPFVQGSQTATTVGPAGKEIYTDEHGRIKVHFHWDRRDKRDQNSSCWIRVSQPWAGQDWGAISIPRIGQEVIVDFLEGDPDRPIVTGRVYNADQRVPYPLPAGERKMGIRSRSTPGGGGYNEVMLDDTKGNEGVTIHAQYNMQTRVEHDDSLSIGNNQTVEIGVDRTETVQGNETVTVVGNRETTIQGNETVTINGTRTETVEKDETVTLMHNQTHTVLKNETKMVALTRTHSVGVNEAVTVGLAQQVNVGAIRETAAGYLHFIGAGWKVHLKAGVRIALEAETEIVLSAGGSKIILNKDGIQISGKKVEIN